MRNLFIALLCLAAAPACAEGFAIRDLTAVASEAGTALGIGFVSRAAPDRLTLMCTTCEGAPMVDLLLGRQADGTEERVRAGQTSMAQLEALCRERRTDCRLSGLSVAPAVGWVTGYGVGSSAGATAIILRGGDLLTIRVLAGSAEAAARPIEILSRTVAARIVGR
ncbi:hypothetical protein SAMN02799631_01007 [Methylobacterium sp. 174MFSha1.1]|uniref:hypothetical protein n=1 Tax=Methylobacterium sp. 174MFSha1.1 TaxID=1502749 RepID=UPI0008EE00A6|nr:hypothetical protein [Methylobacterium sp. 174MFSha1.1]SFU50750.1 hypothetical protein SAMN02799631_01007 [Methylobacterium sp. 174MFSha1.1]